MDPRLDINLPHALTVLGRLARYLRPRTMPSPLEQTRAGEIIAALELILAPYVTDPPPETALEVAGKAAEQARLLVEECVRSEYQSDRIGLCVRNLFECLGRTEESIELSLQCGERPDSPLRP